MIYKYVMVVDAFCLSMLLQAQRIGQFNMLHCNYPRALCCLCCPPLPFPRLAVYKYLGSTIIHSPMKCTRGTFWGREPDRLLTAKID
jgi:hypothetical protein